MTQAEALARPSAHRRAPRPRGRGRNIVVALLVLALAANFGVQTLARRYHDRLIPRRAASQFSGFDSFTLGLLLGGLRGPLVMILWTNSENQKSEKNLENVDTQIELIRLLQADFMTVHIFQMWNKAYNISVQMASLPNKYSTILDAIRYGQDVNREIRDDINIMTSIAEIYFNKLGTSAERRYYIERVRQETKHPANPRPAAASDQSARPTAHEVLLDANGKILPEFLAPQGGIRGNSKYTGADLEFLAKYNDTGGFPDGVSPLALAYNYYKRAQAIMETTNQRHLQLSDSVVDSRPAIAARTWAEEEWGRARLKEMVVFDLQPKDEVEKLDRITLAGLPAVIPLNKAVASTPAAKEQVRLALFAYKRCAEVAADSEREYRRHISNPLYSSNAELYQSHIAIVQALELESNADHDYLMLAAASSGLAPPLTGTTAAALRKKIISEYKVAIDAYYRVMARYFVDLDLANRLYPPITQRVLGKSYQRGDIEQADPKVYPALIAAVQQKDSNFASDSEEFLSFIKVAGQRLEQLEKP